MCIDFLLYHSPCSQCEDVTALFHLLWSSLATPAPLDLKNDKALTISLASQYLIFA